MKGLICQGIGISDMISMGHRGMGDRACAGDRGKVIGHGRSGMVQGGPPAGGGMMNAQGRDIYHLTYEKIHTITLPPLLRSK